MPIFVILLLQCELNQFEFLRKGGPYPTAHGFRYNIRLNYPHERRPSIAEAKTGTTKQVTPAVTNIPQK